MKRPERISIVGKPYRVEYVDPSHNSLEGANGICDPDAQRIYIADGIALETEQETLWHEIKHAVESAMGLDLKETVVERLATGELAVIKANPGLMAYLRGKGRKKAKDASG